MWATEYVPCETLTRTCACSSAAPTAVLRQAISKDAGRAEMDRWTKTQLPDVSWPFGDEVSDAMDTNVPLSGGRRRKLRSGSWWALQRVRTASMYSSLACGCRRSERIGGWEVNSAGPRAASMQSAQRERGKAATASTTPRLECGIRVKTSGSYQTAGTFSSGLNAKTLVQVSEDLVNDPNVLVSLTPTGPDVLGGLNRPNVRERWSQPTSASCEYTSQPLCAKVRHGPSLVSEQR